MERSKDNFVPSTLQRLEILKKVEQLVRDSSNKIERPITLSETGMMDTEQMTLLISGQPSVDIDQLEVGDLVWWRDVEENSYYYLTEKQRESEFSSGYGPLKINSKDGKETIHSEVRIQGATLGTMLWVHRIAKNLFVEYTLPPNVRTSNNIEVVERLGEGIPLADLQYKRHLTAEVIDLGIIRKEFLAD